MYVNPNNDWETLIMTCIMDPWWSVEWGLEKYGLYFKISILYAYISYNPVHFICNKIGWQHIKYWFQSKSHIFQSEFSYTINNILLTWRIISLLNPEHFVSSKIGWQNWLPRPHSTLRPGFCIIIHSKRCIKIITFGKIRK